VITIDLLGFGRAPKPTDLAYSYDDHIAYIHSAIKSLHLSRFTLVGHSMGALLASRYSIAHPDTINELLLLHPPLFKDREEARNALFSTSRFYRFMLTSRLRSAGWALMRTLSLRHISAHNKASREGSLKNIIERAEMNHDYQRITVTTTFLVGTRDRKEYVKNIPHLPANPKITLVQEDVAHHSPVFHPQLIMSLLSTP